jgi:hypothetical protein
VIIVAVGVFAGAINTVVGSGTLVTFPVLLALGYPPITANVSNSLGLVPGSVSGAYGYRAELRGQRERLVRLGICSVAGGLVGAVLLLTLPAGAFEAIVPVLIAIGLVLVVTQPFLARRLAKREGERKPHGGLVLYVGVFLTGVYGGYFGAAQGVILLGLMGILLDDTLQRINATKNVLAALVNLVSGILFAFIAHVDWWVVLLLAVGSLAGGQIGAKVGRRLPPWRWRS